MHCKELNGSVCFNTSQTLSIMYYSYHSKKSLVILDNNFFCFLYIFYWIYLFCKMMSKVSATTNTDNFGYQLIFWNFVECTLYSTSHNIFSNGSKMFVSNLQLPNLLQNVSDIISTPKQTASSNLKILVLTSFDLKTTVRCRFSFKFITASSCEISV